MRSCEHCGGSLLLEDGELKCLACGRTCGSGVILDREACEEVEAAADFSWAEYVAGRRETASARYGESTPESIAEYKRRYHVVHREKDLRDMLRWKRNHQAHLKEYRRRYKKGLVKVRT